MTLYSVIKINSQTGEEIDYGAYMDYEDVKLITKGYTFNGLFYTRAKSKYLFIVTETTE